MNSLLLKLHKNKFATLIPLVIFLSFSLAYLIHTLIVTFLNPPKTQIVLKNRTNSIKQTPNKPMNEYDSIVTGNMVRGNISNEPNLSATGPNIQSTAEAPGADDAMIIGIHAGDRSFARVSILEKGEKEAEDYSTGERVAGYTVKSIYRDYIVLSKDGISLRIETGETIGEVKKRTVGSLPIENLPNKGVNPSQQVISRSALDKLMKNEAELLENVAFSPYKKDGKIEGIRISRVNEKHLFHMLGARSGDIIKRVNGIPLGETPQMMQLYSSIKTATKLTIDIDRKGEIVTYDFIIRN